MYLNLGGPSFALFEEWTWTRVGLSAIIKEKKRNGIADIPAIYGSSLIGSTGRSSIAHCT
jgi:hypothetical protein